MFDVGFSEIVVIAVVALIVIGPERLPRVARTAGALLGRLQRYVNEVKSEVNRELQLEEIHRLRQDVHESVNKIGAEVSGEAAKIENSLNAAVLPDTEDKKDAAPQAGPKDQA